MSRAEYWQALALAGPRSIGQVAVSRATQVCSVQRVSGVGARDGRGAADADTVEVASAAAPIRVAILIMFPLFFLKGGGQLGQGTSVRSRRRCRRGAGCAPRHGGKRRARRRFFKEAADAPRRPRPYR